MPLLSEIDRLAREVAADDDVRVLIVDSADPEVFIAHADVGLILDLPPDDIGPHDELSLFHAVTEQVRTLPKATIAVIDGVCRGGGCEFAMAFDMRFAALGATVLGHPELAVGIIPGGGGTQRLPRLVGRGRALEVILGCMDIDAATAEAWGYVNRALPADQLRRFVDKLAARIASSPAVADRERETCGRRRRRRFGDRLAHRGSAVSRNPRPAGCPPTAAGSDRRRRPDP